MIEALTLPLSLGALLLAAPASPAPAPASSSAGPLALIAGGGTGGHVFPGLAVAEELMAEGWQVAWVGAAGGLESRLARDHQLPFHPLTAKPLLGRGLRRQAAALLVLARSTAAAFRLIQRVDARLVIGTGGYLSAPAALGAWLRRRPLVLLEPNAEAGLANRWLSRLARGAAVARSASGGGLRCPVWVTGVPVRSEFSRQRPLEDRDVLDGAVRVLVLGGSQGALALNRALPEILLRRLAVRGGEIVHQTGASHLEETSAAYRRLLPLHRETTGSPRRKGGRPRLRFESARPIEASKSPGSSDVQVEVVDFLDDIAIAMAESHLVLSRAGAVTLAEICAVGRGAILVPLEIAGGHQRSNAMALAAAGAAVVVEQSRLEELDALLESLLEDRDRLRSMARAARALANPGAAREIAARAAVIAGLPEGPR